MTKPYLAVPHELLSSSKVTNKTTGEVTELNVAERITYWWMFSEFKAFKDIGGTMHHNINVIAGRLGVSEKTIERHIKTLCGAGLVDKHVTYIGGLRSNSYTVHDVFGANFIVDSTLIDKDNSMKKLQDKKITNTKSIVIDKLVVNQNQWDEDPDCPF